MWLRSNAECKSMWLRTQRSASRVGSDSGELPISSNAFLTPFLIA
jgi:hypothetical protein